MAAGLAFAVVDAKANSGGTPLHWAAGSGQIEAADALVKAGADVGIADKEGRTPLDIARAKQQTAIIKILETPPQP